MSSSSPIVSIVIPNYNKAAYLAESLNSLLAQTYPHWEACIVDDASTDDSISVISEFVIADGRFRLFKNPAQRGGNYSRNHGLAEAKGQYLIFFDSDDLLAPNCLEQRVKAMEQHPGNDFMVFASGVFLKEPGDDQRTWIPGKPHALRRFFAHELPWHIMQPIWKKAFLQQQQGFDESFERLQDVELHTRVLMVPGLKFETVGTIPDCYYRVDTARLVFDLETFYGKRVASSEKYIRKFAPQARQMRLSRYLLGTYLKLAEELCYAYRVMGMKKPVFTSLMDQLGHALSTLDLSWAERRLLALHRCINSSRYKPKGVNFVFKFFLIR